MAAGEPIAGENTMSAIWIDDDNCEFHWDSDGIGFLVETHRELDGGARTYSLRQHPPRGNQSGAPRLEGWCGSWNNVSTYGRGLARVARRAHNGRLCLARVPATPGLLDELGYPELAELDAVEPESKLRDRWAAMLADMGISLVGATGPLTGPALDRAYAATVAMIGGAS
jgi:hypothetical protein